MKKVAIILSGCGVFDGAEIHESVLTMLAVARLGCRLLLFCSRYPSTCMWSIISPERLQSRKTRNVLVESARIAQGRYTSHLTELNVVDDFDALLLPGGFGAAKNLV